VLGNDPERERSDGRRRSGRGCDQPRPEINASLSDDARKLTAEVSASKLSPVTSRSATKPLEEEIAEKEAGEGSQGTGSNGEEATEALSSGTGCVVLPIIPK
jgi:hypothetical protein